MSQQVRFNPSSLDCAYWRDGQIVVNRSDGSEVVCGAGHHPDWATAHEVAYCSEDGSVWTCMPGVAPAPFPLPAGNTLTAASGKVAVHRTDPRRVLCSWGPTYNEVTDPVLSADGAWLAFLAPDYPRQNVSTLIIRQDGEGTRREVYTGAPLRPRFSHTGTSLCWEEAGGQIFGIADVANPSSPVVRLSRPDDSLSHPVPLWAHEDGLWVLYVQATGGNAGEVQLAEWGSAAAGAPNGYRLQTSGGSGYDHDISLNTAARQIDTNGEDAFVALLDPDGTLARWAVFFDDPRTALPLPPTPPVVERWTFVPDGTLVLDAFTAMFGAAPSMSPDGKRICLHKNVNEQEWRELSGGHCYHLFDRSRYPGDVGWYLYDDWLAPLWASDTFTSGEPLGRFDGEVVEMSNGKRTRWTHRNTQYGLKGGGCALQFDPRFPGQDYGPEKCYERFFDSPTHGARWELWYTPESARSLPWGDRSQDVLKQAVEAQAQPGQPTPAYIECPRLSVSDDPWAPVDPPQPPSEGDMTHDDIRRYIAELGNDLLFGAFERFHNEVLPRDRPQDSVIANAEGGEMWTGDVTTGGANGIFCRSYFAEYLIARDKGRTPAQASGDGYDVGIQSYRNTVQPQTFRGPISAEGRDFVAPV
jgi:hypothetical protein